MSVGLFFIDRRVFAWVIAISISLAGILALQSLPVNQYPEIAPTTVTVSARYPGANASTVQNTVTKVIEDRLTEIEGLLYSISTSRSDRTSISLVFNESVDPVTAQNDVQAQVSQIESQLPGVVRDQGVTIERSGSTLLLVGAVVSDDGGREVAALGSLFTDRIEAPLLRMNGVGGADLFGSGYAMRIWLDPLSLVQFDLTPNDVVAAVASQNSAVSAGRLGALPAEAGQQVVIPLSAQSQLSRVEDFESILLRSGGDGSDVRLDQVARIEIGRESYLPISRLNGQPTAGFGVFARDGANAVETAASVRLLLKDLEGAMPQGVSIRVPYDTSPFIQQSIDQVYVTLMEAVVLVTVVLMIFLQTWRATIIPLITVPVTLMGTFAVLMALGYTINTLTMFAMVLAIGMLVDDAIVVVENVERLIEKEGLSPLEATRRSMMQISTALVGIVVVLGAVFVPMSLVGGSVGVIYRQFSITIITAMVISLIIALSLTPAMCSQILRARGRSWFPPARWFNAFIKLVIAAYAGLVRGLTRITWLVFFAVVGAGYGAWEVYSRLPASFVPVEDQGILLTLVSTPSGTAAPITEAVLKEVEDHFATEASVEDVFAVLGFSFAGTGENYAIVFSRLAPIDTRTAPGQSAEAIAARSNARFWGHRTGQVFTIQPPAIPGLGSTGGFSAYLVDRIASGPDALFAAARAVVQQANNRREMTSVRADGIYPSPEMRLSIDRLRAESMGVSVDAVNAALPIIFAGRDVNDFLFGDKLRPVIVQADAPHRMQPDDSVKWFARNATGEMVPFSSFMTQEWQNNPSVLSTFDGVTAVPMSGSPGAGFSSGDAMNALEVLVDETAPGYSVSWSGLSFQERAAGAGLLVLYGFSLVAIFLALAALYESWAVPFAVILSVPVALLGTALSAAWFDLANDVYFTVGMLTVIGLSARNAILVIEFAEEIRKQTGDAVEAAIQAASQRLRPILMTALTFMLGVLPLAIASGAGSSAQNAIGIAVLGGMAAATVFGVVVIPGLYVFVIRSFSRA